MDYKEIQSNKLDKCLDMVKKAIGGRFPEENINGEPWFHEGEALWFRPWALRFEDPYDYAIVVEYAQSWEGTVIADDGESFCISDMTNEEIVRAILNEIEKDIKSLKAEADGKE